MKLHERWSRSVHNQGDDVTAVHSSDIELLERLGGIHAAVHRAVLRGTGRVVVVKRAGWDRPALTERLGRAAAILQRVQHPSLIRLVDVVDDADGRTLVLAHAPGGSLADLIDAGATLTSAEVTDLGARLAGALAALHAAGVVHRDVHPGNVLLDAELQPVLTDLDDALDTVGAALEGDDEVVGHPAHVDHRLLAGQAPGPANDLHGLATTLWTLATGTAPPRSAPTAPVALPPHPAVPVPLHDLLLGCIGGRVTTAADARTRLLELTATLPRGPAAAPTDVPDAAHAPFGPPPARPQPAQLVQAAGGGTRRWGPHPASGADRIPADRAGGRRAWLLLAAAVVVVAVVGGAFGATSGRPPAAAAAGGPCPDTRPRATGQLVLADLDGDGCGEPIVLHEGELRTPEGRFLFGAHGDVLLAGDWDGDGRWGLGLYRPATGAVYLVDEPGPDAVSHPPQVHRAHGTPVVVDDGGRHRVVVEPA